MGVVPVLRILIHCRANVARVRQTRPDSGLRFQVNVLETFTVFPSSLGGGTPSLSSNVSRLPHVRTMAPMDSRRSDLAALLDFDALSFLEVRVVLVLPLAHTRQPRAYIRQSGPDYGTYKTVKANSGLGWCLCRANMAHVGQSRLGFQVQSLKTFEVVPSSLGPCGSAQL